jgi:hypothetical protein
MRMVSSPQTTRSSRMTSRLIWRWRCHSSGLGRMSSRTAWTSTCMRWYTAVKSGDDCCEYGGGKAAAAKPRFHQGLQRLPDILPEGGRQERRPGQRTQPRTPRWRRCRGGAGPVMTLGSARVVGPPCEWLLFAFPHWVRVDERAAV